MTDVDTRATAGGVASGNGQAAAVASTGAGPSGVGVSAGESSGAGDSTGSGGSPGSGAGAGEGKPGVSIQDMKGVSDRDKAMIAEAEALLGPEPEDMGFVKNLFWGRYRSSLISPYPSAVGERERDECDELLRRLEAYLRDEHPSIQIDVEQHIPEWVIGRLFELGVLGMTIPKEHGGLGMGITSYNRVLELIGAYCGSTAVVVSAHQSIGCKAVMLFGTEEQKRRWLPRLAKDWLSAFCLSEPNVGCDAGGQETRCEVSEDGTHFILNGEKKWATSGAISGLFTVMAKQVTGHDEAGRPIEKVTALVCTPDMPGIDIFQKNRSKCGIRGTWQARIRFDNVRVPRENLLHKEGRGLNVALTCLNYGRCTLSAGMLGGARRAMDQSVKWSRTRHQFRRPLADFELVQERIARMSALCYAMDAVLYATTGFLDRHDPDIMVETAICKVFCSEMGWRVVNDAMQLMGGESYMTENEVERIFRDSRINLIVEGANDVMQSFIWAYGGKQLAETMLGIRERALSRDLSWPVLRRAIPLGLEVFLGVRRRPPAIRPGTASLRPAARRLARLITELTYRFKAESRKLDADIVRRQAVQARLADAAVLLHAWACTLSKLDAEMQSGRTGLAAERDRRAAMHFFDLAELEIGDRLRRLSENADDTMLSAARAAIDHNDTLPADRFIIPERTPTDARGRGRRPDQRHIHQFPGTGAGVRGGTGREGMQATIDHVLRPAGHDAPAHHADAHA